MEQFEQLLTCAICLDRYRNPKLLPCQHSFCMEPCMDGLVDYVRRQVKCPECRAEHRIPYQGVQGYPTNVTLQRFLELHIEITGELPDPTSGQIMERCSVCSEKSYCSLCVHCDKKVCADCKGAHMDILRREITRINNQVRRGIHRLQDALSLVEKNQITLLNNCTSVTEEIDEIYRRLMKALKDRTESLRSEIERYQSTEQRNLRTLKDNLEQELSNIQSNCELADKHMNDNVDWDDCELMDAKEIFLKTVEFIRNFEYENVDYTRRVRFSMATDPNQLVLHVANYGDLTIASPYPSMAVPGVGGSGGGGGGLLQPPAAGPGLMRSKSDHRLASQFRQEERGGYFDGEGGGPSAGGRASPLGGRKFGERYSSRGYGGGESSRYGRGGDDYSRGGGGGDYEYDEGGGSGGRASRRYRSRLASRHLGGGDGDSDNDAVGVGGRSVRFSGDCGGGGGGGGGGSSHHGKERERVLDTEDASRGPLSGITRLLDSPRVMKRLQESEQRGKKRDKEPAPAPAPQAAPKAASAPARRAPAARQVSEDDEISKIKKQNKASGSGGEAAATTAAAADTTTTTTTTASPRPQSERVAALKQQRSTDAGSEDSSSAEQARRTPPATVQEVATSDGESDDTSSAAGVNTTTTSAQRKTSTGTATGAGRKTSDAGTKKPAVRSASSESSTSSESSSSAAASPVRTTAPASTAASAAADTSGTSTARGRGASGGFQSRFLANRQQAAAAAAAAASSTKEEDEDEEETETSSDSEETESEEESEDETAKKKTAEPASTSSSSTRAVDRTDIGPLLARSANARDTSDAPATSSRRRDSRDEGGSSTAGYRRYSTDASSTPSYRYGANKDKDKEETGSKYLSRGRAAQQEDDTPSSRYGSSGYTSRFLNKSKSSAALSPEEDSDSRKYGAGSSSSTASAAAGADDSSSRYPSGRSRYAALKDRRSRLARSRSSHNFGGDDQDEQDDSPSSPTSSGMPASYLPSRYAAGSSTADLARSRSTHALKSRENSPERPSASASGASGSGEKDGAALSSWARYLKNKYGNRGKDGKDGASGSGSSLASGAGSSTSASRRLSLGLPLRHNSASIESSDDDQKNPAGSPTSPTAAGFAAAAGTSPRSQYLQKRRQLFKIGSRGSEPGNFTWPRGIAVGPDNSIVVADSSNHRVQVFDANGTFVKEFGSYGSGEGEFDCLAGVAVNRIGQFIIADRYNHRIQVMDPAGRFLRAFGSQGSSDGRFNYPWGVTTDALGFIYVCDKENHRVQVFQSDGTFVGKFGSIGNKPGQLEHPHYIAVSNTNRVIVSDSNNHRVQIFDVNGKVVTSFGNEGSEDGQFKFPRNAKRAKSSRPRGSHHSHRAITTKSTKPVTSNTSVISTSAPSTIAIKQVHPTTEGRRSGRPGLHLRGGLRQQPHPNIQPRRHIPESIRLLGIRGRGVQRTGGYSSYIQRQHPGVRSREPSHTGVLSSAANKRLNFNTAGNIREYGPVRRASLPIIKDRFLASPVSLTYV
ncbi:RING finger protein nhl-1 isoform X1 [Schistocerca serialis cubense]|uniref:RING finger protein nhl-1 isoform X1 n=1 Tax=Schistocerca serialis cubense TaxID=2023355 RepID=UPI00214E0D40|nr:RING finger protein nhl-1 isoform X1 [Schistocerca serialis cubense]XP_049958897.1 RING finger protein nhl-1 isoform X1 [Schistocerca serialis cubense]